MYKLLIVDDEPFIRTGLRTIIDWHHYDIDICGEAENGREGLQLCKELQPELVIVDIKMPGMDGLQMMKEAKEAGLSCDFIVLSGYSEFGYAQRAIEFGVSGYLLKPIEQDELEAKVAQLRNGWSNRRAASKSWNDVRQLRLDKAIEQLLMNGQDGARLADDAEVLFASLGMPWPGYQIILMDDERRSLEPQEKSWLLEKLRHSGDSKAERAAFASGRYVGILAQPGEERVDSALMEEAKDRFGLELVIAVGPAVEEVHRISESYQGAAERMRKKFMSHRLEHTVVPLSYPNGPGLQDEEENPVLLERISGKIARAIEAGNRGLISGTLKEAEHAMIRLGMTENQIKAGFSALYADSLQLLAKEDRGKKSVPPLNETVAGIENQYTLHGVVAYVESRLLAVCEQWQNVKPDDTFKAILEFISAHYGQDMKLESLAELFHYNSSYLGKRFKSQTGVSFNAYLDQVRMDKAKQMLASGRKVYEVAALVGYANVDYFHLKFKKTVGESPSAYRDKFKL